MVYSEDQDYIQHFVFSSAVSFKETVKNHHITCSESLILCLLPGLSIEELAIFK